MASEQASQEKRQAGARAHAHPASPGRQEDPAQFEIREQGLCWELRGELAPARASAGRQEDADDPRARFLEHRASKRREGRGATAQAPRSPRKAEPNLPEELHREFGEGPNWEGAHSRTIAVCPGEFERPEVRNVIIYYLAWKNFRGGGMIEKYTT